MQFGNPVVGGLFLVRAAIRSPNYVAGVSGWTINQDGTVEFASGTFRGLLAIGNATYLVKIGDEFGRVQFLNGAGTIEHGAIYDGSGATQYSTLVIARNFNTVAADPPGAYLELIGDNDTVTSGPRINLVTFNPEGRPGERIRLSSAKIELAPTTTVELQGATNVTGALAASGNLTISGAGVNNIAGGTNLNGNTAVTGTLNVTGNESVVGSVSATSDVLSTNGRVRSDHVQASAAWDQAGIISSDGTGGAAAISLRTSIYAAQARLGTGANDVYWRDAGDANYIGHQAAAYTVASREATKTNLRALAGDALDRIRALSPITFRRRTEPTPPEARADLLHLMDPALRQDGPTAALRAAAAIEESSVTHAGFTVENVAAAFPEAIVLGSDGQPAAYDLAAMVAALVHAVQQLDARVSALSTPPDPNSA